MSRTLTDLLPADGGRAGIGIWLKSSAYTQRLLLGEAGDPWESASQYLAYFAQAQGLLKPDVAVLEVGDLFASWLRRHPALASEMASKRKLSFALRKLLEQAQPRAILAEVVAAVLGHLRGQAPLILAMPSPAVWLRQANDAAGRPDAQLDDDSIEDCAMYVADLLRAVSECAIGGLLFEEARTGGPANVALYLPIINLARHYRWPVALRTGAAGVADSAALADIDLVIGGGALPAAESAHVMDVSRALWAGEALPVLKPKQFCFVDIPHDARPELVLENLAALRTGGM